MNGIPIRGAVDLSGWNLDCLSRPPAMLSRWVLDAAQEVIEVAIKQEGILVYLSATQNDAEPSIHCLLPLADGVTDPVYTVNMVDLVREAIANACHFVDPELVSDEGRPELERIRDACREAAGLIESALVAADHAKRITP